MPKRHIQSKQRRKKRTHIANQTKQQQSRNIYKIKYKSKNKQCTQHTAHHQQTTPSANAFSDFENKMRIKANRNEANRRRNKN